MLQKTPYVAHNTSSDTPLPSFTLPPKEGKEERWKKNLAGGVVVNMAKLFVPLVTSQWAYFQNGVI